MEFRESEIWNFRALKLQSFYSFGAPELWGIKALELCLDSQTASELQDVGAPGLESFGAPELQVSRALQMERKLQS